MKLWKGEGGGKEADIGHVFLAGVSRLVTNADINTDEKN